MSKKKKKISKRHKINSTNSKEGKKKKRRKWWKKLLSLFLVLCCFGVFAVFGFCIYIVKESGEFDPSALANQDQTIIYDINGKIITKLGMEKRESVTYEKLPEVLVDAIVATEDSRFFQHNGVDGARFFKASLGQILGNSSAGGASTLTMQVVKNNLTSTEQTIIRKFKDIYLAVFFMEKKYTKKEIIEFYVNDSLLGGNVYGVEEASKYYFGKSVTELSLPEAAIMAGLFQSPNRYNPYKNPDAAKTRMKTVLKLMVRHGYITQKEADIAASIDVASLLVGYSEDNSYQGFIDTVTSEIIKKTGNDPALVSMEVHTTMDPAIQDGINKIMNGETYNWVNDVVQAGTTIIDVKTGEIKAVGAGRHKTNAARQWNYATQSYRQPGSTAKPIFAYAPGFEFANYSTYQLFTDEAWSYTGGGSFNNWDGGYKGLMTLKDALAVSRNVPAVKAFQEVNKSAGNDKIVQFVEGLGIPLKDHVAYESYAIGGLSSGVTTVQMAAAYAAFGNGGYYIEPHTVTSITYRDSGKTTDFEIKKSQAMKDSTAYLMTNALDYAAHYGFSGGTSSYRGAAIAAKTGTSNYDDATMRKYGLPGSAVNDLWTVAYTPAYSVALWYGYDEIDSTYYNSAGAPKDNLMSAIMKCIPVTNETWNIPSSVTASQVEYGSWPAALPSEYTPGDMIKTEYFIAGTEPNEVSTRFSKLPGVSNLKASASDKGTKLTWDYNLPDSLNTDSLSNYFKQSVFGNSSGNFLQERLDYNNNALGGLVYGIYLKAASGTSSLGVVTDKSYTYTGSVSGEIIVKAEYRNYKNNASDGASVKVTGIASTIVDKDDTSKKNELKVSINGDQNVSLSIGDVYSDSWINVSYEGKDVTSKATVTVFVGDKTFTSKSELESYINEISTEKTVKITYNVNYKVDGKSKTGLASRTIVIK